MTQSPITIAPRFDGRVTEVTLGPAPGNIITGAVVDALAAEVERHQGDAARAVRAVVISGAGDHFSYGSSVQEHRAEEIAAVLPRFHALLGALLECPVPTIACVRGLCLGGGFELALACSTIVADTGAEFGFPEIALGVFPPAGAVLLPAVAGPAVAAEMILSGARYAAPEMHRRGVVTRIAEGPAPAAVDQWLESHILDKSASSLRFANRAARAPHAAHYRVHIGAAERLYLNELTSTRDAREGVEAFLEKRAPRWRDA